MGLQAGHLSSRAAVSSPGKWGRSLPLESDVHGLQFLPSGRPVRSGAGEPESASQPLTVGCLTREPTSSLWPPSPGLVEEKGRQGNAGCESGATWTPVPRPALRTSPPGFPFNVPRQPAPTCPRFPQKHTHSPCPLGLFPLGSGNTGCNLQTLGAECPLPEEPWTSHQATG